MSETIEKMTDEQRRIRAAELMGWTGVRGLSMWGIDPKDGVHRRCPDPDHSLDDAVKLAVKIGIRLHLDIFRDGATDACIRLEPASQFICANADSPARALTSAVLKAMEEKREPPSIDDIHKLGLEIAGGKDSADFIREQRGEDLSDDDLPEDER